MTKQLFDSESGTLIKEFSDTEFITSFNPYNTKKSTINKTCFYRLYKSSLCLFKDKDIKKSDLEIYFSLIELLDFNKNEFVKVNGLVANIKLISQELGMTDKTLRKHLRLLESKQLLLQLKKGREKHILINPYVINFGKTHTEEALRIFHKTVWVDRMKELKRS